MQDSNPSSKSRREREQSTTLKTPERIQPTDQQNDVPLTPPDEEIARRAYARWESSDRSHGRDQEHWFAAQEELRQGGNQADLNRGAGSSGI